MESNRSSLSLSLSLYIYMRIIYNLNLFCLFSGHPIVPWLNAQSADSTEGDIQSQHTFRRQQEFCWETEKLIELSVGNVYGDLLGPPGGVHAKLTMLLRLRSCGTARKKIWAPFNATAVSASTQIPQQAFCYELSPHNSNDKPRCFPTIACLIII